MVYLISGVALSGNKGASGMAESLIQNLAKRDPGARFYLFSYYPAADRALLPEGGNVELLDGSPKNVVLLFFRSLWAAAGRLLRLPRRWYAHGEMAKIAECGGWLDASGISFVDGREKFLIFNILSILPALALGVPVVKVAQAMGPFKRPLNRIAAKLVLPRLRLIVARGAVTREYLDSLGLANVVNGSDVAFSLRTGAAERARIAGFLPPPGRRVIGVSPSQVVWKLCEAKNIPYLETLRRCVEKWTGEGCECVVFPHSARKGSAKTHNNDLPLLRRFAAMLPESGHIRVIEEELSAGELRMLIGSCDLLVASRFHAIISAMATGVPAVVIGWSHKYAEVLAPFGLEEYVVPYDSVSEGVICEKVRLVEADREALAARIRVVAAEVAAGNDRFFDRLAAPNFTAESLPGGTSRF